MLKVPTILKSPTSLNVLASEGFTALASSRLPTQQLNIGFTLISTLRVIKLGAREDANHLVEQISFAVALATFRGSVLCELDNTACQRSGAVLQVFEGLLVHLGFVQKSLTHGSLHMLVSVACG